MGLSRDEDDIYLAARPSPIDRTSSQVNKGVDAQEPRLSLASSNQSKGRNGERDRETNSGALMCLSVHHRLMFACWFGCSACLLICFVGWFVCLAWLWLQGRRARIGQQPIHSFIHCSVTCIFEGIQSSAQYDQTPK